MKTELPQPWHSRLKRLNRVALPVWVGSVVVAAALDLVYKRYGGPAWVGSVVVHLFQALGLCAMGLFIFGQLYAPSSDFRPGKVLKILALVFGAITLLLGLWGVWGTAANLLALIR